jgi:hypothetical protein
VTRGLAVESVPVNIARAVSIASLVFVVGCVLPPPGSGQGAAPASTGGPSGTSDPQAAQAATPPPSAPVPTSVELHNDCPNTVPLFLGAGDGKPGFSSGTKTSIGSNTTSSFPRNPDGTVTIWIIDNSENGVTSLKVTPSITRVSVNCTTLAPG